MRACSIAYDLKIGQPAAAAAAPAAAAASKKRVEVCKATAQFDYTAVNREVRPQALDICSANSWFSCSTLSLIYLQEEIDLAEGDLVSVEYKAANGWWVGTNTRTQKSGIFPGTYVEINK